MVTIESSKMQLYLSDAYTNLTVYLDGPTVIPLLFIKSPQVSIEHLIYSGLS